MSNFKAIIPCSGYGTRMFCKPDQSKEMLILPSTQQPLIQDSLDLCKKYDLTPHIITRAEKTDLIEYMDNKVQIVESKGEWSNTVLQSEQHWDDYNILILPDTRWDNPEAIAKIKEYLLLGSDIVLGLHEVEDPEKWGIVQDYSILEKPKKSYSNKAWGIIGFTKKAGYSLFHNLEYFRYFKLYNTSFVELKNFRDLTRTGKLT